MKHVFIFVVLTVLAGCSPHSPVAVHTASSSDSVAKFSTPLSDTEALLLVRARPDVQEWLRLFTGPNGTSPTTGGTPQMDVQYHSGSLINVWAYESMPDHAVTFGYYDVDTKTGTVTREIP